MFKFKNALHCHHSQNTPHFQHTYPIILVTFWTSSGSTLLWVSLQVLLKIHEYCCQVPSKEKAGSWEHYSVYSHTLFIRSVTSWLHQNDHESKYFKWIQVIKAAMIMQLKTLIKKTSRTLSESGKNNMLREGMRKYFEAA